MTSQTPFCNVDSGGEGTQSYFGIMHMGGNVVEWTEDQHSTMAPLNRDIRGGDWANGDWDQWNVNVNTAAHDHESMDNGFRIFATIPFAQDPTGGILPDILPRQNSTPIGEPFELDENTIALCHFDESWLDASTYKHDLTPTGNVQFSTEAPAWMWECSGTAAYFAEAEAELTVAISDELIMPSDAYQVTIEWMQLIDGIVVQNPAETNAPERIT
ncbi:MAG: hypothetical protein ABF370_01255 [Verrucomicrobiales bacterium]